MAKIALEEHFIFPDFLDYLSEAMPHVTHEAYGQLVEKLSDFGDERLAAMDAVGVTFAVLSLSGPGVQVEKDTASAIKRRSKPMICWPRKYRNGRTAMAASRISPCRTPAPPPPSSNAACATSASWAR
jgi:hypothetical protein